MSFLLLALHVHVMATVNHRTQSCADHFITKEEDQIRPTVCIIFPFGWEMFLFIVGFQYNSDWSFNVDNHCSATLEICHCAQMIVFDLHGNVYG